MHENTRPYHSPLLRPKWHGCCHPHAVLYHCQSTQLTTDLCRESLFGAIRPSPCLSSKFHYILFPTDAITNQLSPSLFLVTGGSSDHRPTITFYWLMYDESYCAFPGMS